LEADFVCCRHTLEHIPNPYTFLQQVADSLQGRRDAIVFFEVPDMQRILVDGAFWDIYYEHCSYFTRGTLGRLFRAVGLDVNHLARVFNNQYVLIEGRLAEGKPAFHPAEESLAQVAQWITDFRAAVTARTAALVEQIDRRLSSGRRVVLWGGGSKAVALLTLLADRTSVEHVVDLNRMKHGKFIPGTGQEVIAPTRLVELQPDTVIIMNSIYREEIRSLLQEMHLQPELIAL
jgi:hypothetical protein